MNSFLDELLSQGLTAFGKVMVDVHPPKVRAVDCRTVLKLASPGDIILRSYSCYLDHFFIPGEFTHSGIVENTENSRCPSMAIHAVAESVSRIDLLDFCKECDQIALLRPTSSYNPIKSVEYARNQVGKPYDFHFSVESDLNKVDAFFCHKLTALSLKAGGLNIIPELRSIGPVTHEVYIADQFLNDQRIKVLYRC